LVPVDVAITIAVMGLALTYEAIMLKLGRTRLLDPRLPALAGEALEVLTRKKSAFKGLYLSLQLSCIAIASAWPFLVPMSAFRERGWLLLVLLVLWPVLTYIIADLYVFKLTRGLQRMRPSSCVEFLATAAVGTARFMAIYLGASLVALAFFLALKVSLLAALACGAVAFLLAGLLLRASGRARVISEALRRAGLRPRSRR